MQLNLKSIIYDKWNPEFIWGSTRTDTRWIQSQVMPRLEAEWALSNTLNGVVCPTLELVETFYSENGVPIEEDIKVEASDNGFIIRIPYCDGYLFRFGEARFVYSKGQDDFILTAYEEEIIDRQHTELDGKVVKYNICAEVPIVLSTFSVVEIRNSTDNKRLNIP